jgi:hypothetical protein
MVDRKLVSVPCDGYSMQADFAKRFNRVQSGPRFSIQSTDKKSEQGL